MYTCTYHIHAHANAYTYVHNGPGYSANAPDLGYEPLVPRYYPDGCPVT